VLRGRLRSFIDLAAVQKNRKLLPGIRRLKPLADTEVTIFRPSNGTFQEPLYRIVLPIRAVWRGYSPICHQCTGKTQEGLIVIDLVQGIVKLHCYPLSLSQSIMREPYYKNTRIRKRRSRSGVSVPPADTPHDIRRRVLSDFCLPVEVNQLPTVWAAGVFSTHADTAMANNDKPIATLTATGIPESGT
jgi:hypothetical protein